jgi:predicted nucleotide-binding protein
MNKKEAIESLKQALTEIKGLNYNNEEFQLWFDRVQIMCGVLGPKDLNTFLKTDLPIPVVNSLTPPEVYQNLHIKLLGAYEVNIKKIIQKYEILGFPEAAGADFEKSTLTESPKAFIAHGGESPALRKLKSFLEALGVQYLIAEVEPSNGRLVEPQVTQAYEHADFAIILATKTGVIDKKKGINYMAMNVADELGRGREVFKNRIILLLETGVEPHTNISGIVYERFAPQSMDKAFIKIAKELKNWGFIRAGKAK